MKEQKIAIVEAQPKPQAPKPINIGSMGGKKLRQLIVNMDQEGQLIAEQRNRAVRMFAALASRVGKQVLDVAGNPTGPLTIHLTAAEMDRAHAMEWSLDLQASPEGLTVTFHPRLLEQG